MSDINPHFKIKYARGFGDVITYILHGSPLKRITQNVLRIKEPCSQCSKRASALNKLFPIPIWKMFFKSILNPRNYTFFVPCRWSEC